MIIDNHKAWLQLKLYTKKPVATAI